MMLEEETAPVRTRKPKPMPSDKLPKDVDLGRLSGAMESARRVLQRYREERKSAVEEMVGAHYSDGGSPVYVPVNLIALYVTIMARALVAKAPRAMLTTSDPKQRAPVSASETWLNDEIEASGVAETLHRIAVDAFFSVGIAKISLCDPGHAATKWWNYAAGQPYLDRVDLDDFVFDVHARDFTEVSFIGHRYRCPYEVARKIYKKGAISEGAIAEQTDYNEDGDEKIGMIGRGDTTRDEFEDHVTLWEIYLPRHKLILTLAEQETDDNGGGHRVVRVQNYIGPETGPYEILGLCPVPGAAMPLAPIMNLIDLHRFVNRSYRKLFSQTDRYKSVLPVKGGAVDEAGKLRQVKDGEMFQADNADALKELAFGGPSQGVFLMAQHTKELFSWMAGNLDLLGGLAPQSKTAAQDKMLNQNAGMTVSDMQATMVEFVSRCLKKKLWLHWNHPELVMNTEYRGKSDPDLRYPRQVYPAGSGQRLTRDGEMPKITVDPYSFQHQTPQQRLAFLRQFVGEMTPLLGLLAQQGIQFDANAFVSMVAKYADEPDVVQIFKASPPMQDQGGGDGGDIAGMPANTSREYTRRSLGADGPAARQEAMTAIMESGGGSGTIQGAMGGQ